MPRFRRKKTYTFPFPSGALPGGLQATSLPSSCMPGGEHEDQYTQAFLDYTTATTDEDKAAAEQQLAELGVETRVV